MLIIHIIVFFLCAVVLIVRDWRFCAEMCVRINIFFRPKTDVLAVRPVERTGGDLLSNPFESLHNMKNMRNEMVEIAYR